MKAFGTVIGIIFGVIVLVGLCLIPAGCKSIVVEAGHVGYIYSKPLALPGGGFTEAKKGPYRKGITWRKYVTAIDVRQRTYTEAFEILAQDDLNISFQAHTMLSVRGDSDSIQGVVEEYMGTQWYDHYVKERLRTYVRNAVRQYTSRQAKEKREEIAKEVFATLAAACEDKPFVVHAVTIGNIDYPDIVQKAVEKKLAAQQTLEEEQIKIEIETKKAQARVEESKGIAEAQRIINESLTENYLRHEYVEALVKCASQPNTTIIYVPLGRDGLPFVGDVMQKVRD